MKERKNENAFGWYFVLGLASSFKRFEKLNAYIPSPKLDKYFS